MKKKDWYLVENGKYVIEIRTDSLEQLFDKRDPNPFRSRDLDDDAAEYILSCASEIGPKRVGKIRILTMEGAGEHKIDIISKGLHEFFRYREDITLKKIRAIIYLGLRTLVIGLLALSISIFISYHFSKMINDEYLKIVLKEGLLLIVWVSMWKPINIFLYEWWPMVDQRNLFQMLSSVKIEIVELK